MRESQFVEQNKEKWSKIEEELRSRKKDPTTLRSNLIQVTDDLSYSRTFYKNRSVRVYLNGLAQQLYNSIYKNRRNLLSSVKQFFTDEVPRIMYFSRKELLISFLVLLLSIGIGVFSSMKDSNFAESILGADYVSKTIENIDSGNPMGVYKDEDQLSMFYRIAVNNLTVSLYVFLFGLFASYGALVMMVRNGVMLGVFMYFFYSRQLSTEFNYTVWLHGSIEILTLVVETVAGMLLGRGLIYPGTMSRAKAFSVWGRRGAMVFLSTVPFIITAAFIESFLTRHTELPNILRGTLIVLSVILMLFYFVWLPYKRFGKTKDLDLGLPELKPETKIDFKAGVIYSPGAIFLKSIQIISKEFLKTIRISIVIAFVYIAILLYIERIFVLQEFRLMTLDFTNLLLKLVTLRGNLFSQLFTNLGILFNPNQSVNLYLVSVLWVSAITYAGLMAFKKTIATEAVKQWQMILYCLLFASSINSFLLFEGVLIRLLYGLMLVPMLVVLINVVFKIRSGNIFTTILAFWGNGMGKMLGLSALFLLLSFFVMLFIVTPLYYLLIYVIDFNLTLNAADYQFYLTGLVLFSMTLILSFAGIFLIIQSIFLTYTLQEVADADGIRSRIQEIGKSKKAYGIETE
jgi:uncharacterized membrane protein SpoIIM required for sporulation